MTLRDNVIIVPCSKCGLSELFDAPSDLRKAVFPDIPDDEVIVKFTVLCGACRGSQVVEYKLRPRSLSSRIQTISTWVEL